MVHRNKNCGTGNRALITTVILSILALLTAADWPIKDYQTILRENYPSFGELFGDQEGQFSGYNWVPFNVTTDDNWALTLFRIRTGCSGGSNILFLGDTFMDSETWLRDYFVGTPMPL